MSAPYYEDDAVTLWHGDCLDIMATLPDASVDAVVTDPPYGLGFMGREWDDLPPGLPWARECLRVLKPGGHLLAFGGSRTWHRLAVAVEDAGFEVRDSIAWLYGSGFPKSLDVSKAIDKAAGREPIIVGFDPSRFRDDTKHSYEAYDAGTRSGRVDYEKKAQITAPATDAARQWSGWGTALKPAHEPVVVARKPLFSGGILAEIGSHLDRLETTWRVRAAEPETPTGGAVGSSAQTDTLPSESEIVTSLNTVSSWRACWAEISSALSTSTTVTTSATTTDLRTLSSSLSRITDASTVACATSPHGLTSIASAVDHLFASVVCGLRATLALSATERATGSTPPGPQDAAGSGSRFEPIVVARKPLAGTVAANVLAHGTGALNVDGCRVGAPENKRAAGTRRYAAGTLAGGTDGQGDLQSAPHDGLGRWPTNVVLDGHAADELDAQSGVLKSGANPTRRGSDKFRDAYGDFRGQEECTPARGADSGGASRFFPTFRYQAKAPTRERVKVGDVAHPTVKPLELMRWLVRLVTPPGGLVLEPFAGSGTTVEAAILEGFQCIAIEREADYLPLIRARIDRNRHTPDGLPAAAEALALFDFEEPA